MSALQFFFRTPWAKDGDTQTIPEPAQPSGQVSFDQGFGVDYELSPSDVDVLYPERRVINEILFLVTQAIQVMQTQGFPNWIAASDNDGASFPYAQNAFVRFTDKKVYFSAIDGNTDTPGTTANWVVFNQSSFQTGDVILWESSTIRSGGWVWANGQTIGDASSNATGRANADTLSYFTQIWTEFPNSIRPIVNSDGTAGSRGVSAAADYAAHKALPVRDLREIVPAGTGTMGGASDPGRITQGISGFNPTIFGNSGGAESEILTTSQIQHEHELPVISQLSNAIDAYQPVGTSWPPGVTGRTRLFVRTNGGNNGTALEPTLWSGPAENGPSAPVPITQWTAMCNFIIKL